MATINPSNQQISQYSIQTGGASNLLNNVAPSATSGVPVISQGASAQPVFGTAVVAGGGTGATTLTGVLTGNGTSAVTANAVTNHGVLLGSASNAVSSLAVATTGTVLAGSTGADPAFTATPSLTSITLGAGSALSTYVTGSFTPILQFGGGTTGITYTTQIGEYTQIGNVVFYQLYILLSNKGSSTGNATIVGLPVTSANNGQYPPAPVQYFAASSLPANTGCYVNANSTTIILYSTVAGTASNPTNSNFGNTTSVQIAGMYWAS